ncbi:MAG TPA: non-homologous end-joining DNA ligase, partial [Myxococcota bacterium]|nr:non-homologous end-joining DNA ligase [Myxococcota bacterium]
MAARQGKARPRLESYRSRRRFDRTPEPAGGEAPKRPGARRIFVIQKHAASRLHYDFRLELDGVLLSWSVPKGPSLSPADRRLAVRTEDHPLEYADFEGIIPKGEYGGGTVMVWDRGTWTPEGDAAEGVRKGRLTFTLAGRKLRGRWHLVRTRLDAGKRENWLLFKGRDEAADERADVVGELPDSALTGRSLEEIGASGDRVWRSNRAGGDGGEEPAKRAGRTKRKPARAPDTDRAPRAASEPALPATTVEMVRALPVGFPFTNLEKVLYPEQNLRKAELVAYYALVAEWMLPHVRGRPLTLVRCPDGRHKHCFYQKHAKEGVPEPVRRIEIPEDDGGTAIYMAVDDMPGLVALAQLGALEVHTWMSHADRLERPDQLVVDVDPDEGLGWERVVDTAQALRRELAELGLESFVKTTGGKGLHVVAPVKRRLGWEEHKEFARALVTGMERAHPDRYTTNVRKVRRQGRLYLDYLRNGRGATAIAPYSSRAREGATVATPITWEELESDVDPRTFTVYTVTSRLAELEHDPWAGYG